MADDPNEGVMFNLDSAKLIAECTRRVWRMIQNRYAHKLVQRFDSQLWVPFRNDSSETCPAHAVMAITGLDGDGDEAAITCNKHSTTLNRLSAVNATEDVAAGQYGLCTLEAPFEVLYSGTAPTNGKTFGPKPNEWELFEGYPGFISCGAPVDTTTHIMLAVREEVGTYIGQADEAIAVGASGDVRMYVGTAGSETDSGVVIADCYNRTQAIEEDDWVTVSIINGQKYVALWSCPT